MVPAKIYKFYDFSVQSLKTLKKQIIYFGSPKNFNDPYDCATHVRMTELSLAEVESLRSSNLAKPDLPPLARHEFTSLSAPELRDKLTKIAERAITQQRDEFLQKNGVCCFTEGVENLLLWAHYSGKFRGFCLEFDTAKEPDLASKLRKVDYVDVPPRIDTFGILSNKNFDGVLQTLFCTKNSPWAYEKEWRAIHVEAGKEWCYRAEALTGVFFGPEMDFTSKEIIALILAGQNPHVTLWDGRLIPEQYKVGFQKMTYTPYIVAKNRGLIPPDTTT